MRNYGIRSIAMMLIAFLIVQTVAYGISMPSFADAPTGLSINYRSADTGTVPFNTTNQSGPGFYPGDDYSASDSYVRTLDTVTYNVDYGVNPAGTTATGVVFEAKLEGSSYVVWNESMKKNYIGVDISPDGKTLTYNRGDIDGGQAFSFSPVAKVLGQAPNGEKFKAKFTLRDNTTLTSTCESEETIVSSSPKFDLRMETFSKKAATGPNNEKGIVVFSTIEILIENGKGSEIATNDLTFDVDLSEFRSRNIHPILYDFSTYKSAVTPNYYSSSEGYESKRPWSRETSSDNAVKNPEKFIATQTSSGDDIAVTIKGADLSGNIKPSLNGDGSSISLTDNYLVSGILSFWIPASELPDSDTSLKVSYKNFDPNSVSGASNFGAGLEPLNNNSDSIFVKMSDATNTGGGGSYLYADMWYSYLDKKTLYGEDDQWENRGVLAPGEMFMNTIKYGVGGDNPSQPNAYVVYKFDPTNFELVEQADGKPYVINFVNNTDINDFVVEFGTGGYASWDDMRTATGTDADSLDGWHEDYKAVNGQITKIRIRNKSGIMPGNSNISLSIMMRIKANAPIGGSLLGYLSYKADNTGGGAWYSSEYKLDTNDPLKESRSENAFVSPVHGKTKITTSKDVAEAGDQVSITVQSSLTSQSVGGVANDVYLNTIIPKGAEYVFGSSRFGGMSFDEPQKELNADGSTTLKWSYGDKIINAPIGNLSFDINLDYDIKNQSVLELKSIISTPADYSDEKYRDDTTNIIIINQKSWGLSKKVINEVVEINEDIIYKLRYFQTTSSPLHNFTFIDILPFNGDKRSPATSYNGNYVLKSVLVSNGETVYVTNDLPTSIEKDLSKPSTNNWYPLGIIPNEDVTALKIVVDEYPNSLPTREMLVTLTPKGNKGGDIYTNNYYGRTDDLAISVDSNDVAVRVVASSLSGYIWEDTNGNGTVDSTEIGFTSKTVDLYDSSNKVVKTIKTDTDGKYSFTNLKSGSYTVKINDTFTGHDETFEADSVLDQSVNITLNKGEDKTNVNFGYQEKPSSITGYVWEDTDDDGAVDASENRLVGNKVYLYDSLDNEIGSYDTDSTGKYTFTNLKSGTYTVKINDMLTGYDQTYESDPVMDQSTEVTLNKGDDKVDVNFGYQEKLCSITGYVWEDTNDDGAVDASENRIVGNKVYLYDSLDNEIGSYDTDSTGKYTFTNLKSGTYTVKINDMLTGYDQTYESDPVMDQSTEVTLNKGDDKGDVNFGYQEMPGSISGYVWEDSNNDGVVDASENVFSNMTVEIYDSLDNSVGTVETDSNGYYLFNNLYKGDYKVVLDETLTDYDQVFEFDSTLDKTVKIKLGVNQIMTNVNFGFVKSTGKVIVNYLEKGTNKVLSASTTSTGIVGDGYTTKEIAIDGYKYVESVGDTSGKYTLTDNTVTYYYEPITTGNVVVKYLEEGTDKELTSSITKTGAIGTTYDTEKKSFDGYSFVRSEGDLSGVYKLADQTVTYYYEPITTGTVVVKYLEEGTNKELTSSITNTGAIGTAYNTEKKSFDGYSFVKSQGEVSGVYKSDEQTVTYYYAPITTGTVVVKYLEEGTDKELTSSITNTGAIGTAYNTEKKSFDGYSFVKSQGEVSGNFEATEKVVTYYYTKMLTGRVIVYHRTGNILIDSQDLGEKPVGTPYITSPTTKPEYSNYDIIKPDNATGVYENKTIEVTYYYTLINPKPVKKGTLIVKYLEKGTDNELVPSETTTSAVGTDYVTTEKSISDYVLDSTPANSTGSYIDGTITVSYYYVKQGKVIVKHLEYGSDAVLSPEIHKSGNIGESYSSSVVAISGYTFTEIPSNSSGNFIDGTITVIYYYDKDESPKKDDGDKEEPSNPTDNTTPDNNNPTDDKNTPDNPTDNNGPNTDTDIPNTDNNVPDTDNTDDGKEKDETEVVEEVDEDVIISIDDEEVPKGNKEVEKEQKSDEKNTDAYLEDKRKKLPQTGESDNSKNSGLLGILLMLLGTVVALKRKDN